ncbi:hypothetical protein BKA93DRAFT_383703 [Sparassis latifolia]
MHLLHRFNFRAWSVGWCLGLKSIVNGSQWLLWPPGEHLRYIDPLCTDLGNLVSGSSRWCSCPKSGRRAAESLLANCGNRAGIPPPLSIPACTSADEYQKYQMRSIIVSECYSDLSIKPSGRILTLTADSMRGTPKARSFSFRRYTFLVSGIRGSFVLSKSSIRCPPSQRVLG